MVRVLRKVARRGGVYLVLPSVAKSKEEFTEKEDGTITILMSLSPMI